MRRDVVTVGVLWGHVDMEGGLPYTLSRQFSMRKHRHNHHGPGVHARLPPRGVPGWQACLHAQPGCPSLLSRHQLHKAAPTYFLSSRMDPLHVKEG